MTAPFVVRPIMRKRPRWVPPFIADAVLGLCTDGPGERW